MDLSASWAGDWQVWDNTEAVSYESSRRSAVAPDPDPLLRKGGAAAYDAARTPPAANVDQIAVAKRRAVTSREKSPSGGVYVGFELRWVIPAAMFGQGFAPKPGDVVIPADGARWTVLTTQVGKSGATWILGTVDLILANDLQDLIVIERAAVSFDPSGAAVKTFPPAGGVQLYAQLPARVQLLSQEVKDERGVRAFEGKYSVIVGRPVAVTAEDRVRLADGSYLDIVGVTNPNRIDELQQLECVRKP